MRSLFPEVGWPDAGRIGLPHAGGRILRDEGLRMGWAHYGDGERVFSVFLSAAVGEGWHTNVRDDAGDAVVAETSLRGVPARWVTRSDGVHCVLFETSGVRVLFGGNLPAERVRGLAETAVLEA